MPMMFTSATVGLGMLLSFSRAPFEWSRAGLPLLLAQTMLVLPVAYVSVLNRLDEVDPQMQFVAQSLGASRVRAYFSAYGSRLSSGMLAAAGLAAAIACGEYGAASFLSDFQSPTLTVQLMRQLGRPGESSLALASILATTLALVALAFLGVFETTSRTASKVRR
jgi:ABC-type spermidine/putrescine transport system permease subunit II